MSSIFLDEAEPEYKSPEPIKMSWITDFTLICNDRDVLVVRECLTRVSKPLAAALEDMTTDSLEIPYNSEAIIEVMKAIHNFPDMSAPEITVKVRKFNLESAITEFCFKYEIEPLLTNLKKQCVEKISHGASAQWIKFFHSFRDNDGKEIFKDQTNAMRLLAVNNANMSVGGYFYREKDNDPKDVVADYRFIILGLLLRLRKTEAHARILPENRQLVTLQEILAFDPKKSS